MSKITVLQKRFFLLTKQNLKLNLILTCKPNEPGPINGLSKEKIYDELI
jgi:hypothetical protein